jgi:hypothetical protein
VSSDASVGTGRAVTHDDADNGRDSVLDPPTTTVGENLPR